MQLLHTFRMYWAIAFTASTLTRRPSSQQLCHKIAFSKLMHIWCSAFRTIRIPTNIKYPYIYIHMLIHISSNAVYNYYYHYFFSRCTCSAGRSFQLTEIMYGIDCPRCVWWRAKNQQVSLKIAFKTRLAIRRPSLFEWLVGKFDSTEFSILQQ